MIEQFLNEIAQKDSLQYKYLLSSIDLLDKEEQHTLTQIIAFFEKKYGSISKLADAYLLIVDDIREETKYFLEHKKYRNASYKDVSELVYYNDSYMEQYMIGLVLSDYIWTNHVQITRWFREHITNICGTRYLEIGPGFGHYFTIAINNTNFDEYKAVDISPKSVEGAKKFVEYFCIANHNKWCIDCDNFLKYEKQFPFDCIVMGEVLEHVENPEEFLKKIYSLLNRGGNCFISTVINAPAIDHIYLFSSIEEVTGMMEKMGFTIVDYLCTTENNVPLEKAIKKKRAITIILNLTK